MQGSVAYRLKLQLPEKSEWRAAIAQADGLLGERRENGHANTSLCIERSHAVQGDRTDTSGYQSSWTQIHPCDLLRATVFFISGRFDTRTRSRRRLPLTLLPHRHSMETGMPSKSTAPSSPSSKTVKLAGKTAVKTAAKPVAKKAARAVKTPAAKVVVARKPVGMSLHLGLNSVSAKHYEGWSGDLTACEFDANDMAAIATARGIKPTVLLTKAATRAKVLAALRKASSTLKSGDYFLLSYSGHGGQVDDVTGEEDDKLDETWCLYDSQLIDDELYLELSRFAAGVRVLVLSDSCHSGTVTRAAPPKTPTTGPRPRMMPPAVARRTYLAHKTFYDTLQKDLAKSADKAAVADPDAVLATLTTASVRLTGIVSQFNAAVTLISGCQDNQTSMDGEHNGAFTEQVLRVWGNGKFAGNHRQFHARIRAAMPATQSPNLFMLGNAAALLAQTPFTI
jgi:hypothetical protein